MPSISDNYHQVQYKVLTACALVNRDPSELEIVAVSKKQPVEKIQELISEEQPDVILGENYVKEYAEKKEQLSGHYKVHLIGPLQSNKAKKAVELFDVIESVGSVKLLQVISKEAVKQDKTIDVFLQVNISEDPNKSGFLPDELNSELFQYENVNVLGLMTITKFYENKEDVRPDFRAFRELRDRLVADAGLSQLKLSMGMSSDFEIAIEEGADLVRVGTAIFGERSI